MDKGTILLIDRNIDELRTLVATLRRAGFRLALANRGADGFARASFLLPDLILLDLPLPGGMDGFATCRLLKADPHTCKIPIIFLAACDSTEERLATLRSGAVDFIAKPANEEEVLLRVSLHLQRINRPMSPSPLPSSRTDSWVPPGPSGGREHAVVAAACQLIQKNIGKILSVDALARMVGTHRRRLTWLFQECYGCSPAAWAREQRLQSARNLLDQTSLSVQSVSDELGFSTPANFSSAFKKQFGSSPRQYRRKRYAQEVTTGSPRHAH